MQAMKYCCGTLLLVIFSEWLNRREAETKCFTVPVACFRKQRVAHVHYNKMTSKKVCGDFVFRSKVCSLIILIAEFSICFCDYSL